MRLLILAAGLVQIMLAPQIVVAQGANPVMRAGEHADFTRLVMPLPDGADWYLIEADGYIDVVFSDPTISVDLSQAFDRIPRTRLRTIEPIEGGIRLQLSCPCSARRVNGVPGQLVLDLWSPEPDDAPEQIALRPRARPALENTRQAAQNAGVALARSLKEQADPEPADALALHTRLMPTAPSISTTGQPGPVVATTTEDVTQKLGAAISGAVVDNLLKPNPDFEQTPTSEQLVLPAKIARHIQSQDDRREAPKSLSDQLCQSAVSAWVADWSVPPPPSGSGQDWQTLYDPLDRVDEDAVATLVTELLRSGFGAEARSLLGLLPDGEQLKALHNLTYVIDLEPPPNPDILPEYAKCSDFDLLWAFLSDPAATLTRPNAQNRVVRATQGLSETLRHHLGGTIINQLLRHDAAEAAGLVQAVLERSTQSSRINATPEVLLAQPESMSGLRALDLIDLPDTDLLLILENAQRRDLTLAPDLLSLAVDRQFALRRSDIGRQFAHVTARLLARAQEFDAAFRIANSAETGLTQATRTKLLSDLFDTLVQTATDSAFVTVVFTQAPWELSGLSGPTVTALRTRLEALGFAEVAQRLDAAPAQAATSAQMPEPAGDETARDAVPRDSEEHAGVSPPPQASGSATPDPDLAPSGPLADTLQSVPFTTNTRADASGDRNGPMVAAAEEPQQPAGLLSQGRQALERSAELRERLQSLMGNPSGALTQ